MCYEPNDEGQYAEGMKIRADALQRHGLPAADRGGMGVCLPGRGGHQPILRSTRWNCSGSMPGTRANMPGSGLAVRQLLPNDLGLFDMLGNVYEWCQDSDSAYKPEREGILQ